ncbi:sigma-54-dependent transcriptional regulator [Aureibacter tunicatorum]|uniref:DNA-binding NtrC family response regulator n=1 Tax=Aureibacter tunicatorum TaxID=866807 RepID=A0AAE3XQ04_9BACT|nr:sigma-54 dependent transcriptional regulator [Aureibacter tunicatorum]MDR6240457.1 DNA-binding NtrC family response regulator [Aureibacter tunicatorum]BDD05664.1 sigma-54-dependent Fis family transcriptional regulator [Aureibacter tunicatorum]
MKRKAKVLIVDDNQELLIALKILLSKHFSKVETSPSPERIPSLLSKNNYDLFILDMNYKAGINTGNEGLYWLNQVLKINPEAIVLMLTAYSDLGLAVKAVKAGATDFMDKAWSEARILSAVFDAFEIVQSRKGSVKTSSQSHQKNIADTPKTNSARMQGLYDMGSKVASTQANVLILGENGTGKEVMAQWIHANSNRKSEPFVKVDVSALTSTLFESELFGHKKGSFTDAHQDRIGRFELANGGTLFLDEIGNIPLDQQSKLLSVLQNREVFPVGSEKPVPVDIRLICATNKDIHQMVDEGTFREDLLYRINTIPLELPALRDRKEDISLLSEYFLEKFNESYSKDLTIDKSAHEAMKSYAWPGNIRELEHTMEKAVILCTSEKIQTNDLSLSGKSQAIANGKSVNIEDFNLETNEKTLITQALDKNEYNISRTAKTLGISRSTLYEKMKKYAL